MPQINKYIRTSFNHWKLGPVEVLGFCKDIDVDDIDIEYWMYYLHNGIISSYWADCFKDFYSEINGATIK